MSWFSLDLLGIALLGLALTRLTLYNNSLAWLGSTWHTLTKLDLAVLMLAWISFRFGLAFT